MNNAPVTKTPPTATAQAAASTSLIPSPNTINPSIPHNVNPPATA